MGLIDGARCQLQIDIGFGDAVTPGPEDADYPVMLAEFAPPKLLVYPRYTVVAEKFEAMTMLGIANSRMKDYFDLWVLARNADFEGDILRQAVRATFERRRTALSGRLPFGITEGFAHDAQKVKQWQAFQQKNRIEAPSLIEVIELLADFMLPVIEAASANRSFAAQWSRGGPWTLELLG
jgi:hypothetical protein